MNRLRFAQDPALKNLNAPELVARASAVAKSVGILSLEMARGVFERGPGEHVSERDATTRFVCGFARRGHDLQVSTEVSSKALFGSGKDREVVSFVGSFLIRYSIAGDLTRIGKAECEAFARLNGIYHVWPYWREFVQSSSVRMGLPPLVFPPVLPGQLIAHTASPSERQA